MGQPKQFYVYIMANIARTIYVGMTSELERRVYQHKHRMFEGFTAKYGLDRLVYFETTNDARVAAERERQIKAFRREKKLALVESLNPSWRDLSREGDTEGEEPVAEG